MSDISLDALRLRERELELDAVLVRGRIEEVRMLIAQAERRRGGRPRKPATAAVTPLRVTGGEHEPETDEHLFPAGDAA
jgi:hypothetical protein